MFEQAASQHVSTLEDYNSLALQLGALTKDEPNLIANLANISAVLFDVLGNVNWAGFYLKEKEHKELVLGPFQGKVACVRIPWGQGVCGVAAESRMTQHVDDVHQFPGHIACDSASKSEVVIPIEQNGEVVAVLDIDSPNVARFSTTDVEGLALLKPVLESLAWQ